MKALVALILIGALGFVMGRFLFLRPRPGSIYERIILSGAEFLVIGALIGPSGLGILDHATVAALEPFLILALSWVGLLIGIQLRWRHLIRFPWPYFEFGLLQATVAMIVTFVALAWILGQWTPVPAADADRWRAALCLAAIATLSSPSEAMLHERAARGGHLAGLLRFTAAIDPLVGLGGLALLVSLWHGEGAILGVELTPLQWLLASVTGGMVLGGVFLLLLWSIRESDELVLVVLGMALFSGGLASVFHLSPLVVCLVVGIVLSNWRPHQEQILHMFLRLERPLYVTMLVLAGASWKFGEPWGYLLATLFVLVKFGAKFVGVRAATAATPLPFAVPPRWWGGLVPQGAMAIAIAVSYLMVFDDPLADIVFSAILVSTVLFTFISRPLVEMALGSDSGDAR